jgi:hypothetical protein
LLRTLGEAHASDQLSGYPQQGARCRALPRKDLYLLVIVWALGLVLISVMHAGTGVVVSTFPDDTVESGPEVYTRCLKVRSRLLEDRSVLSDLRTQAADERDAPRPGLEQGPTREALGAEPGCYDYSGSDSEDRLSPRAP